MFVAYVNSFRFRKKLRVFPPFFISLYKFRKLCNNRRRKIQKSYFGRVKVSKNWTRVWKNYVFLQPKSIWSFFSQVVP